jgi:hypothetical protein
VSRLQRARQGASKKGAPERKSGRGVEVNFWDSPRKNEPRKRVPDGDHRDQVLSDGGMVTTQALLTS